MSVEDSDDRIDDVTVALYIMLTRQEMDGLVGKTLIIRDFPHICLATGDDALLLLQIAVKLQRSFQPG